MDAMFDQREGILPKFHRHCKNIAIHYHKLQTIWYLILFLKCSMLSINVLFYAWSTYHEVFGKNAEVIILCVIIIAACVYNYVRLLFLEQLNQRFFKSTSNIDNYIVKTLSIWHQRSKILLTDILKLLKLEDSYFSGFDLKSLLIFDAITWVYSTVYITVNALGKTRVKFYILLFLFVTAVGMVFEFVILIRKRKSLQPKASKLEEEADKFFDPKNKTEEKKGDAESQNAKVELGNKDELPRDEVSD